jgi:hypothetical protein
LFLLEASKDAAAGGRYRGGIVEEVVVSVTLAAAFAAAMVVTLAEAEEEGPFACASNKGQCTSQASLKGCRHAGRVAESSATPPF